MSDLSKKVCPLSMINVKTGDKIAYCLGKKCMFWNLDNDTCDLKLRLLVGTEIKIRELSEFGEHKEFFSSWNNRKDNKGYS